MERLRKKPANRRPAVTHRLVTETGKYHVTLGYDLESLKICEVFIAGPKAGSEMQSLLDDAAVLLSLALQYGLPHAQLLHSLCSGRAEGAASLLGQVVELLHE